MTSIKASVLPLVLAAAAAAQESGAGPQRPRPNILLITADDLNYDSVGVYGGKVADITPNIDALARQGMRFDRGHVTIAVCQPSRSVLMTGRYPHRNGARGFEPIRKDVPTLTGLLRKAGYVNGILGKTKHLAPQDQFAWDFLVTQPELGMGRDPTRYRAEVARFLALAKQRKQPFFLMANSHDPHRPFAGSQQERRQGNRKKGPRKFPGVRRTYRPEEVVIPGFLPDIPKVREEIAQYFTSVHRCDETVGEILAALREAGLEDETFVLFVSDNGMALPFAKTNVYLTSTRVPWIVRWPGKVRPGAADADHFVSGIDYMPTALEIAGVAAPKGMDGRSFLPLLLGEPQDGRDQVLTFFHRTSARRDFPMRCLQTRRFGYIRNAWSDGQTAFRNESQSGLSFRAMQEAAAKDAAIAARVRLFEFRVDEELYDFEQDPNALRNLAGDPGYREVLQQMRDRLHGALTACEDPEAPLFRPR